MKAFSQNKKKKGIKQENSKGLEQAKISELIRQIVQGQTGTPLAYQKQTGQKNQRNWRSAEENTWIKETKHIPHKEEHKHTLTRHK